MSKNTIAMDLKSMSVKDVKTKIESLENLPKEWEEALQMDSRAGVRQIVIQWHRRKKKQLEEEELYSIMRQFEDNLYRDEIQYIAGIDEVGRGPLAGPVVAAAVILPQNIDLIGINDSKQLSEKKREAFYDIIQKKALSIGVGIIEAPEIDRINIYESTKQAMIQALAQLDTTPQHLLIDAMRLNTGLPETSIIKGDSRSISIAAASIVAKVTRDRMMVDYHNHYPHYQFSKNMGYGTREHLDAINTYGPTPLHRMSFAPLNQLKG